ncbi:MAG: ABC-F family ATP-binding cassette domain-containing protein, partial [Methylococcales bacterium]
MLNFNTVSLRRGTRLLFNDGTFVIHRGYKLGLTGANGSGKTSFLQLVLGELSPDQGNYEIASDLVFACVAQETAFDARAAIDVVMDGDQEFRRLEADLASDAVVGHGLRHAELLEAMEQIDGYSIRARAAKLMQGLGFGEEQLNKAAQEFSGGWQMRLNLARALMCRSDVLLLDEPTNHLDLDAVIWLQDWLKNYPGTLILISHDREFLDGVTDHIAHIENQSIRLYTGNYSLFEKLRADYLAQQESLVLKQQREVQHMRAFIDRFRAKASKAK